MSNNRRRTIFFCSYENENENEKKVNYIIAMDLKRKSIKVIKESFRLDMFVLSSNNYFFYPCLLASTQLHFPISFYTTKYPKKCMEKKILCANEENILFTSQLILSMVKVAVSNVHHRILDMKSPCEGFIINFLYLLIFLKKFKYFKFKISVRFQKN